MICIRLLLIIALGYTIGVKHLSAAHESEIVSPEPPSFSLRWIYSKRQVTTCAAFTRQDGIRFLGYDAIPAGGSAATDYATCCALCEATTSCTAFTFDATQQRCYPKYSIGTGGVNSTTGTVGYLPNTCDVLTKRTGVNFGGNDIFSSGVLSPDYASCCAMCKRTSNCMAFSYNVNRTRCYPKTSIGNGGYNDSTVISGYNPNSCDVLTKRTGVNFGGNDIFSSGVLAPDYASCCATCKRTSNCMAFSYNVNRTRCYPKTSIGNGGYNDSTVISGYNPNTCDVLTQRTGVNFGGNDIISGGVVTPDYASCCAMCKRTSNCTAFSYNVNRTRCYPKTSIGNGGYNDSLVISGYNPTTCHVFKRRDNFDFPGNDLVPGGGLVATDYATCCALCRRTANCTAFTFNAGAQRCYPKSSIGTGGVNNTAGTVGFDPEACSGFTRRDGIRFPGNLIGDTGGIAAPNYATCCASCKSITNCVAFTFSAKQRRCYPKSRAGAGTADSETTSAVKMN